MKMVHTNTNIPKPEPILFRIVDAYIHNKKISRLAQNGFFGHLNSYSLEQVLKS